MRRLMWPIFLAMGVFILLTEATAQVVVVNPEKFLHMSTADQILYTRGVLDTLTALYAENLIPAKLVVCSRNMNYGELISGVKSYLHKGLGSEKAAVKEAMRVVPVSTFILREYWAKCGGGEQ